MIDCLFCKIINKEIPANIIYEDDKVLAFLDVSPVHKGHTLIIPKEHHPNLLEMPDQSLAEVATTAQRLAKAIKEATNADGFNITQNNGAVAGQSIFHFHLHIIPRFAGDGLELWPHTSYEEGEANKMKDKIVSFIKE